MELIIRSISQYKTMCTEIIHLIIERLVLTLRVAIDSKNDAQQVILLNLLKVVLFEHEKLFYSASFREASNRYHFNAKGLFESSAFFSCFIDGLRSESSFVRYHYILFAQKLVPLMQKILETECLVEHANKMIKCFSDLLQRSDVSSYESNKRAGQTYIMDDELEQEANMQQSEVGNQRMAGETGAYC